MLSHDLTMVVTLGIIPLTICNQSIVKYACRPQQYSEGAPSCLCLQAPSEVLDYSPKPPEVRTTSPDVCCWHWCNQNVLYH